MSDSHSHGASQGHGSSSHTGGDMNLGKIVIIGAVSLTIFALGIVWAYRIMIAGQDEVHANGMPRVPTEIGKAEIGIVDQVLFSTDHRLDDWKAEKAKHLETYGWVDRAKGIAHMPIEKAMEQVVASPPDIVGEGVPPVAKPLAVPRSAPAGNVPAAGGKP